MYQEEAKQKYIANCSFKQQLFTSKVSLTLNRVVKSRPAEIKRETNQSIWGNSVQKSVCLNRQEDENKKCMVGNI